MTTFLKQSNFSMNHHGPLTQAGLIPFAHFRALKTCGSFILSHQTMANWFSFLLIISHFELHVTGYVCSEYDNLSLTGMYLSKAGLGTCLNINLGFLKKVSTPFISTKLKTWRSTLDSPGALIPRHLLFLDLFKLLATSWLSKICLISKT